MSSRPRAFTLIELIIVIAVIGLLTGIVLPSLGRAHQQALKARELAASRQLMQGYLGYAMDNNDSLIPGHITESIDLKDDLGLSISPAEAAKRWPWRLATYLNCGAQGSLLVNNQATALADRSAPMWAYMVSLTPSFGLNYFNLGGDLTNNGVNNAPGCLKKIGGVSAPSRMIVFCSARSIGATGPVDGYFKIVPPTKSFEYSANGWSSDDFQEEAEPAAWGYVHPRWGGTGGRGGSAVIGFLDGHSGTLNSGELRDMTRWSNEAAIAADPGWRAP